MCEQRLQDPHGPLRTGRAAVRPSRTAAAAPSPNSARRHQVGEREVGALQAEARELDRHHQHARGREPEQEVVRAGQRRRAARAAERGDRQAAHVGAKAELVDQVGVQRRDHDPRARHRDDQVDSRRRDAAARASAAAATFRPSAQGVFAVARLALAQRARPSELGDRLDAEAALDGGVIEERHHRVHPRGASGSSRAQLLLHLVLRGRILGYGGGRRRRSRAPGAAWSRAADS